MHYYYHYESPIGGISMYSDGEALTGLMFDGEKYFSVIEKEDSVTAELPVFAKAAKWLDIYFAGDEPDFTPAISLAEITPFRREVCEILLTIPYGSTTTYGEIAEIIRRRRGAAKMSAQAVGQAVGHNPVSIIIPCHRVVGADGSMTGYGGGIDKKVRLLALEGHASNSGLREMTAMPR